MMIACLFLFGAAVAGAFIWHKDKPARVKRKAKRIADAKYTADLYKELDRIHGVLTLQLKDLMDGQEAMRLNPRPTPAVDDVDCGPN